ncbi:MAG: GAF domain-containing protein, partial [Planctomycetota bacterium]
MLGRLNSVLVALSRAGTIEAEDQATAFRRINKVAAHTLEVERAGIWLFDRDADVLRCADRYALSDDSHGSGRELPIARHPAYFGAVAGERSVVADDAWVDPQTLELKEAYLEPRGIRSLIHSPIRVGGRLEGILGIEHVGPPRFWESEEQTFAASLADMAAMTIEAHSRREAEQALRTSEARLQERQTLEGIGRLAGGVAHDFNNLLSVIIGNVEMIQRLGLDHEEAPGKLSHVLASAEKAAGLTRQLLTFARRQSLEPTLLSPNRLVEQLQPLIARL